MMLWVYCASIILFLGAQLVQVLGHPDESTVGAAVSRPAATDAEGQPAGGIKIGKNGNTNPAEAAPTHDTLN
jgi:hypothetical protein